MSGRNPIRKKDFHFKPTDRKLRLIKLLVAASAGIIAPVQTGQDKDGTVWFLGRKLESYSQEEFEQVIGPYEDKIASAPITIDKQPKGRPRQKGKWDDAEPTQKL